MHSAKGLEFDKVIIPKINKGIISIEPDEEDDDAEDQLKIERSLLFIGMTRARKELYLTCSCNASKFIDEMDKTLCEVKKI